MKSSKSILAPPFSTSIWSPCTHSSSFDATILFSEGALPIDPNYFSAGNTFEESPKTKRTKTRKSQLRSHNSSDKLLVPVTDEKTSAPHHGSSSHHHRNSSRHRSSYGHMSRSSLDGDDAVCSWPRSVTSSICSIGSSLGSPYLDGGYTSDDSNKSHSIVDAMTQWSPFDNPSSDLDMPGHERSSSCPSLIPDLSGGLAPLTNNHPLHRSKTPPSPTITRPRHGTPNIMSTTASPQKRSNSNRTKTKFPSQSLSQKLPCAMIECSLKEFALVLLTCDILWHHGGSPVGLLGTLLHRATQDHKLPTFFKEKYGGLKKFIARFPTLFEVLEDHRFNPTIELIAWPCSTEHKGREPGEGSYSLALARLGSRRSKNSQGPDTGHGSRHGNKGGSGSSSRTQRRRINSENAHSMRSGHGGHHSASSTPSSRRTSPIPRGSSNVNGNSFSQSHNNQHHRSRRRVVPRSQSCDGLALAMKMDMHNYQSSMPSAPVDSNFLLHRIQQSH